jgi:hypothetical protein
MSKKDPVAVLRAMGVTMSVTEQQTPPVALVPELRDFVDGMTGGDLGNPPWDPSDFTRCQRALKLIPRGVEHIGEVANAFPKSKQWARLSAAWPELDKIWSDEEGRSDRMAPKLYARLQELTR